MAKDIYKMTTAETNTGEKYTMTISRRTIENIGIRLYDRISAVLSELVANAYDADATEVKITLPLNILLAIKSEGNAVDQGHEIKIEDNGLGMTEDEVNKFYLRVGINRRQRGEQTSSGRKVMGRKGIGKLAPFGVCKQLEVVTAGGVPNEDGYVVSNFVMDLKDIVDETDFNYHPSPGPLDGQRRHDRGTTVILKQFERKRVPLGEVLNRQLSARFGIRQPNWNVEVFDSLNLGNSFLIGNLDISIMEGTQIDVADRPIELEDGGRLDVTGWVAYAREPYKDEAMAGVRIFTRGKLVAQTRDFDIPSGFTGEYKMRSYIVGEIHADWLDESEDLVRSDRQDIIWNSDLGESFRVWGRELVKELAGKSEVSIRGRVWDEFREQSQLESRLMNIAPKDSQFRRSVLDAARTLVSRGDRESIQRDPDHVERVVQLAFAIGPHRDLVETLEQIAASPESLDAVIKLFEKASVVEIYSLGQVAQERVDSVQRLQNLIGKASTVEPDLQCLIERAPWIVEPEWTPLSMNQSLSRARTLFESWYEKTYGQPIVTSAIDNPTKRPDFIMLNNEGCLEIIEIKRTDHSITDVEYERAFGYLEALEKFISENEDVAKDFSQARLTIICDHLALNSIYETQLTQDPRIFRKTWYDVLNNTMRAHEDFLKEVRRMQGMPSAQEQVENS